MKAQSIIKNAGYFTDLAVPPDDLCECCELGLVINPTKQHTIEKLLKENGLNNYRISQRIF
ncbi:MAG: hypothetical protein JSV32_06875 [Dehalococcoidia bacterium]|nr:MAG: hypothetical protein JSV32_06875 [Dehalococcoidia bacterium]